MYSVINVDISANVNDFDAAIVNDGSTLRTYLFLQLPVIRGSSTVNWDSAHSNEESAQKHNYVSFYVHSIKVRYDIDYTAYERTGFTRVSGYVILFKLPYNKESDIRNKIVGNRLDSMILYSHPENVLAYDVYNFCVRRTSGFNRVLAEPRYLNFNKPFVVGPNDYVGICYFFPGSLYSGIVSSTAKVIFKPQ